MRTPVGGPRHARHAPGQVPAVLVLAWDVAVEVDDGAHRWLDHLAYVCDVEARRWQARQAEAVQGVEAVEGQAVEPEGYAVEAVEPVEPEGQAVEPGRSAGSAGSAGLRAAA